MKKIRIGILAFLLTGITGLAAANNPFTDVPEGHWAYNSINKLVDALVLLKVIIMDIMAVID